MCVNKLLNRSKTAAPELLRYSVGCRDIGINHSNQANSLAVFSELVIDAGMIAPKGSDADHSNIDDIRGFQDLTLGKVTIFRIRIARIQSPETNNIKGIRTIS
jgi:hypothetical protein